MHLKWSIFKCLWPSWNKGCVWETTELVNSFRHNYSILPLESSGNPKLWPVQRLYYPRYTESACIWVWVGKAVFVTVFATQFKCFARSQIFGFSGHQRSKGLQSASCLTHLCFFIWRRHEQQLGFVHLRCLLPSKSALEAKCRRRMMLRPR